MNYEANFKVIRKAHNTMLKLYDVVAEFEADPNSAAAEKLCVVAQKTASSGWRMTLVAQAAGVYLVLSDKHGQSLAQTAPRRIYEDVETFSINYGDDTYTAVLEASDTENDFENGIWFPLVVAAGDFTGIDNFQIPAEDCPPLDASGVWGVTLAEDSVRCRGITVRYELLASISRDVVDGEDEDSADICESLVISDGKHFNSVKPAWFFELPDGGSRNRETFEEATVITEYAGELLVIHLIKC